MDNLPTLITDLALILISAGIITLIFKKLKQPLVLGYIVAGFICSPHFSFTPSVVSADSIKTWADIGVIFLLFALGLDFSFKKLLKMGGSAIIAAMVIVAGMICTGYLVGLSLGWKSMDCVFLGGMIAMSSTSIIYKALDDMGLRSQKFAGLVLSILVIEDIVAIALMVMLSTIAVKNSVEGTELIYSISKLLFFLILWFVVGILLIPTFFKKTKKLMNDETMLIVTLGMCLFMVFIASFVGFSSALGAFVMGSILAETIEAEKIEKLIKPVKDLFGAIFFVSVGMMVNPVLIGKYAIPIIIISITVIIGQIVFGTFGVTLSGQKLKTAIQCGFCLTQIGEFAFIIASLGISLHVTDSFLYPIVVAVSVITTFLTPFMMKLAEPTFKYVDSHMPPSWHRFLDRYSSGTEVVNRTNYWKKLLLAVLKITMVYSVVIIAILILYLSFVAPFIKSHISHLWASTINTIILTALISPFLRAIVVKKNHSIEFESLWNNNRYNRGYLVSILAMKYFIAVSFIVFVISSFFDISIALVIGISCIIVGIMVYSRMLKKQSIIIERRFMHNFKIREINETKNGHGRPEFAGTLLTHDLHLCDFTINENSEMCGKTLKELNIKNRFDIDIVAIFRGNHCINIPGGDMIIFPQDRLQAIGDDNQLNNFGQTLENEAINDEASDLTQSSISLKQLIVETSSKLVGKAISQSGIRNNFNCLLVGIERDSMAIRNPSSDTIIQAGDLIWIVGNTDDIYKLSEY